MTSFAASAARLLSTSHTAAAFLSRALRFTFPCGPTPICPVTMRSLAPKARAGTKYGAAKRVEAAAEVCRKERRERGGKGMKFRPGMEEEEKRSKREKEWGKDLNAPEK